MSKATESMFDGKHVLIPLAEVCYVLKFQNCIEVRFKDSTEPLTLVQPDKNAFISAWCRYRGEVEADTLMDLDGAQPTPSVPEGWLRAIDEALVVAYIGVVNANDAYEQAKAKLLQDFQKEANPAAISELLDRLEAAEKERDALRAELSKQQTLTVAAQHIAEVAQSRANQLRARIEAMERQEPVAWVRKLGLDLPSVGCVTDLKYRPSDIPESSYIPLYLAPGAQGE